MTSPEIGEFIAPAQEKPKSGLLQRVGQFGGRIGLSIATAIGGGAVVGIGSEVVEPVPASAGISDYPYTDSLCQFGDAGGPSCADPRDTRNKYNWYRDENGDGKYSGYSENISPYGYYYRNCTDYAAWMVKKEFGKDIKGWGDAENWDSAAKNAGYAVDVSGPEPGDLAIWDSKNHVAFVLSVNPDGSVNIADSNGGGTGKLGTQNNLRFDHYIDINGEGVIWKGSSTRTPPPSSGSGTTAFSVIGEGGEMTNGSWVYTKAGGRAWPIETLSTFTQSDRNYWSGGSAPAKVSTEEIHANEVGYGSPMANPPGDRSILYYDGGSGQTQYFFYQGNAYPITATEAQDFLNNGSPAIPVPRTANRMDPFIYDTNRNALATNRMRYRYAGTANVRLMALQGGGGFHSYDVNNDTVLDCLQWNEPGGTWLFPQSLRPYLEDAPEAIRVDQPAACDFPDNMVLRGPGGVEQWAISGDNSSVGYRRHYYPSALSIALNTGNGPRYETLRSISAINGVAQGPDMGYPTGLFFRNTGNGDVFMVDGNQFRKVPNPDVLACRGNPPVLDLSPEVVGNLTQGTPLSCNYEGRIIYGSNGEQFYIHGGTRQRIGNTAISACISVRRGAGSPIPVPDYTLGDYAASSQTAYCFYEQETGLNFVREANSPTVWLVRAGGIKHHVGSLCVQGQQKRWNVYVVPDGETAGHVQSSDWFASQAACDALPG